VTAAPIRAFVSVGLPAEVNHDVDRRLSTLRTRWPDLRWTPPQRRHLTLVFIARVSEHQVPDLVERLGRAASRSRPLSLRLEGGGHFGGRVTWLGVAGDRLELKRLAERVSAAARRAGIDVENRRYRPHVSVARASGREATGAAAAASALAEYRGPQWRATSIDLVRSHQGPQPRYETMRSVPLGDASG
jgi:2'-5' RNA ligase